ncbi:MAG: hypothetical protein HeimC2_22130 [Candidatus Heimdallarchaeota archaeon LC_2]|nr:MAG: hypothetical protein HeimC2_22130 [Candidatus Heimdallarchaeota archaeon LC_2]
MSSDVYSLKNTTLIGIIVGSIILGLVIGGFSGYSLAPSGGEDFDLPEMDAFRMGFIPAKPENVNSITTNAGAFSDFLSEELGIPVEVYPVGNGYEELILAFQNGQVDAAFLDGTPSHFVVESGHAEVVLAELRSANNAPFYNAAAWVRADSPINSISTMLNGSFISAHTSETGTAGMVMPLGTLIESGDIVLQDGDDTVSVLERYFIDSLIGGSYGGALLNVLNGNADVAFVRDTTPMDLYPERADEVRLLHVFGKVPSHPVVVSTELAEGWKFKFVNAMLKLNDQENVQILTDLYGAPGLVGANNLHLKDVSAAIANLPWLEQTFLEKKK